MRKAYFCVTVLIAMLLGNCLAAKADAYMQSKPIDAALGKTFEYGGKSEMLVSKDKSVKTSASYGYSERLTDGSILSCWQSKTELPSWAIIDLGEQYEIAKICFVNRQDRDDAPTRVGYEVQVSDNESFEDYKSVGKVEEDPGFKSTVTFSQIPVGTYRYVRVISENHLRIAELEVYSYGVDESIQYLDLENKYSVDDVTLTYDNKNQSVELYVSEDNDSWIYVGRKISDDGILKFDMFNNLKVQFLKIVPASGDVPLLASVTAVPITNEAEEVHLENIALGKTASAVCIWAAGCEATNANDGNSSSFWASATPQSSGLDNYSDLELNIDLGKIYNIRKIDYTTREASMSPSAAECSLFEILGSNTADFSSNVVTLLDFGATELEKGATVGYDILQKNAVRYIKVRPKERNDQILSLMPESHLQNIFCVAELALYADPNGISSHDLISVEAVKFIDANGNMLESLSENEVTVLAEIKNNNVDTNGEMVMVVAYYNADKSIISMKTNKIMLEPGSNNSMSVTLSELKDDSESYIKAFFIESTDEINPYIHSYILK